jgi:hypothetical protein
VTLLAADELDLAALHLHVALLCLRFFVSTSLLNQICELLQELNIKWKQLTKSLTTKLCPNLPAWLS